MAVRAQEAASMRLDEIFRHTRERWGQEQAERYIAGLFATFDQIVAGGVISKRVPVAFGVEGYFFRHEHHFVYWRWLANGDVGVVTILHERMHQMSRFKDDFWT